LLAADVTLGIVIPTIAGREDSLKRCMDSYKATSPTETIVTVVHDMANWPTACNEGARRLFQSDVDTIHFTADDLEALPGWHEEAVPWLEAHQELPAPVVMNHSADGVWDNAVDGADRALTHFTRIPLMTRDQWELIGPWPEIDYGADVWLSVVARTYGIQTRMIHSYRFVHHWNQVGRLDSPERLKASHDALNDLLDAL